MNQPYSRRDWCQAAATGLLGISLAPHWLNRLSHGAEPRLRRRCIVLWMDGGPSHLDTFDPKPEAPAEVRGPLRAVATDVPGIRISESFAALAPRMSEAVVIRSMSTPENGHSNGRYHLHTGYLPKQTIQFPSLGAICSHEQPHTGEMARNYFHVGGGRTHGCQSGYLGIDHHPIIVDGELKYARPSVSSTAHGRRIELLRKLDRESIDHGQQALDAQHRRAVQNALDFARGPQIEALDITSESDQTRDRYGRNDFGRGCLQARRLLQSGASFVEVNSLHWDHHSRLYAGNEDHLMHRAAEASLAMVALLDDLQSTGLLAETLVIWMGEFGRTPRLSSGATPGRDHHSKAWSVVLFGAGIAGGTVVGSTDKIGEQVVDRPVSAADFLATVCLALEIDYRRTLMGPDQRPIPIVDVQSQVVNPIDEIL